MEIELDLNSAIPLAEQLRLQISGQIRLGELKAGDRLASVRQLANDLGISPGTVVKAYRCLQSEGLIELAPGRAATVTANARPSGKSLEAMQLLVVTLKESSINLEVALQSIAALWKQ